MRFIINELHKRNSLLFWFGFLNFVMLFICLGLMASDKTYIQGNNAWNKPVKYFFSTGITLWTFGWIFYYLNSKKIISISSWVIVCCLFLKNSIIFYQSYKGVASHFNLSNPTNSLLYQLIIISDALFLMCVCSITYLFFVQKKMPISQHYTWGVRLALMNFLFFSIAGIIMHITKSHLVGGISDEGHHIPFLNWSTKYGDLRIIHFMGIHSLQIIPLTSYYLFSKKIQVIAFAALYLVLGLFLLAISLTGAAII